MTKEEFKESINQDTAVTFQFCKKLYGYGYYDREYIQSILDKFDEMGRPFAKYIFGLYLKTELKLEAEMYKEAGQDMPKELDRNSERMVKESQWRANQCLSNSQPNNYLMQQKTKLTALRNRLA